MVGISLILRFVKTPEPEGLKAWQQRMGFTRDAAAAALGMSRSGYGFLLSGRNPIDRRTALACLALEAGWI